MIVADITKKGKPKQRCPQVRSMAEQEVDASMYSELPERSLFQAVKDLLSQQTTMLAVTIISAVLVFLPLYMRVPSTLNESTLAESLEGSLMYYESSIVSLTLSAPMTIDWAIEYLFDAYGLTRDEKDKRRKSRAKNGNDSGSLTLTERALLIAGFVVQPCVALLPVDTPNLVLIWLCARRCQIVLIFNVLWISWARYDPKHFTPWHVSLAVVCSSAAQILNTFVLNGSTPSSVIYVHGVLGLGSVVAVLLLSANWIYLRSKAIWKELMPHTAMDSVRSSSSSSTEQPKEATRAHEKDSVFFPFVYISCGWVAILLIILEVSFFGGSGQLTPLGLCLSNFAVIFLQICLVNFYLRRVKFEAISNLYALIDAKKRLDSPGAVLFAAWVASAKPLPLRHSPQPIQLRTLHFARTTDAPQFCVFGVEARVGQQQAPGRGQRRHAARRAPVVPDRRRHLKRSHVRTSTPLCALFLLLLLPPSPDPLPPPLSNEGVLTRWVLAAANLAHYFLYFSELFNFRLPFAPHLLLCAADGVGHLEAEHRKSTGCAVPQRMLLQLPCRSNRASGRVAVPHPVAAHGVASRGRPPAVHVDHHVGHATCLHVGAGPGPFRRQNLCEDVFGRWTVVFHRWLACWQR